MMNLLIQSNESSQSNDLSKVNSPNNVVTLQTMQIIFKAIYAINILFLV